jgi:hypothetical protein
MENTPNNATNPLSKYFRQPSIYIKLLSNGKYWPNGTLDLPVTGEIPIYPMTAKDEITLRTPDALMSGSGVVDVIHSCCPCIKDAWKMPSIDVDAVLIAIRIASFGESMDMDTTCPYCGDKENRHSVDLRACLAGIVSPDYDTKVDIMDLKIKLKPQAFFGVNKTNKITYEEQKLMKVLEQPDIDVNQKTQQITEIMNALLAIGIDTVTDSTEYIEMFDGTKVANPQFIKELYHNADGTLVRTVQAKLVELGASGAIKAPAASCGACKKEYRIPLTFDYANFFVKGS